MKDADFDFIVVRSEDLVDPEQKFETFVQLADFVGSPKTVEEICCLSRKDAVDLGQSINWTGATKPNRRSSYDRKLKDDSLPQKYGSLQQRRSLDRDKISSNGQLWRHHLSLNDFGERKGRIRKAQEKIAPAESPPKINERYGKWRRILKDKPDVSAKLHKEGAQGLSTFGYEPYRHHFADPIPVALDFNCDERVVCD